MLRAVLLLAFVGLVGCHPPAAWDHQKLAHPTMSVQPIEIGLDAHVRAVSEGATGGITGGGGGCGCN